eukprot:1147666-Amorphochlora_amoeboformis.AAC.2
MQKVYLAPHGDEVGFVLKHERHDVRQDFHAKVNHHREHAEMPNLPCSRLVDHEFAPHRNDRYQPITTTIHHVVSEGLRYRNPARSGIQQSRNPNITESSNHGTSLRGGRSRFWGAVAWILSKYR